jgi:hypothetical protein
MHSSSPDFTPAALRHEAGTVAKLCNALQVPVLVPEGTTDRSPGFRE